MTMPCPLVGWTKLSHRIRYLFIWSFVAAHVTFCVPARTVNGATWVFCGPREYPNIFQGTGQHWLIFQENKGINLIVGDRNVAIRKTHQFLCTGHTHLLLSIGNRSVSVLY